MRRWRIILLGVLVTAVAAVLVGIFNRPASSKTLADGTILRIGKVTFGKQEPYKAPDGALERAKWWAVGHLPQKWAKHFQKPPTTGRSGGYQILPGMVHTNDDALQIWISRWDPAAGAYDGYQFGLSADVVDEHGCVFPVTTSGHEYDPKLPMRPMGTMGASTFSIMVPTVSWVTFEAFPRHQKRFRLRVYGDFKLVAEFDVVNPMPKQPLMSKEPAKPLPVTVKDKDLTFALKEMSYWTNRDEKQPSSLVQVAGSRVAPVFEVEEQGRKSTNWIPVDVELWDGSGDFASKMYTFREAISNGLALCPEEGSWRYVVRFCGMQGTASASNTTWQIEGLNMPGRGDYTPGPEPATQMGNVSVRLVALGGIGEITYTNGKPTSAAGPAEGADIEEWFRMRPQPTTAYIVRSTKPYVAITATGLTQDQRLTVRVRDDKGREYYAAKNMNWRSPDDLGVHFMGTDWVRFPGFQSMDMLEGAKTVDLTITVHNVKTETFIFKPPQR